MIFLELTDDEAVGIKPQKILKIQPKYSPYYFILLYGTYPFKNLKFAQV